MGQYYVHRPELSCVSQISCTVRTIITNNNSMNRRKMFCSTSPDKSGTSAIQVKLPNIYVF